MTFDHGRKAIFKLDNAAGALTDITAYLDSVSVDFANRVFEASGLGSQWEDHRGGLATATISLSGSFDPAINTQLGAILTDPSATTRSFEYGPQGQIAGKPQVIGECRVAAYRILTELEDAGGWEATLQVSGAVTFGTY